MTDLSKLVFVNTDGDIEESSSSDSLQYTSFKTQSYELTDARLGQLQLGVQQFTSDEGTPRADVVVLTNALGFIDTSFLQYDLDLGGHKIQNAADGVADSDVATYGQLRRFVEGVTQKRPVYLATQPSEPDIVFANDPVAGALVIDGVTVTGALVAAQPGGVLRVLVKDQTAAGENGIYDIAETAPSSGVYAWARSADFNEPAEIVSAVMVSVSHGAANDPDGNAQTRWMMTSDDIVTIGTDPVEWDKWYVSDLQDGDGITMVGDTINIDLADSEPGLTFDGSNDLSLDWFTPGTDDPAAAAKAVRAYDLFGTGANQGASLIGLRDVGNWTAKTNVEEAIQEIYGLVQDSGQTYTAGEDLAEGDLVYISGNDAVAKYTDLTVAAPVVGIVLRAALTGEQVLVGADDTRVEGAVVGATPGTRYYWHGTGGWQTTMPTTPGYHVWRGGYARNATDLHSEVEFIKKAS